MEEIANRHNFPDVRPLSADLPEPDREALPESVRVLRIVFLIIGRSPLSAYLFYGTLFLFPAMSLSKAGEGGKGAFFPVVEERGEGSVQYTSVP